MTGQATSADTEAANNYPDQMRKMSGDEENKKLMKLHFSGSICLLKLYSKKTDRCDLKLPNKEKLTQCMKQMIEKSLAEKSTQIQPIYI